MLLVLLLDPDDPRCSLYGSLGLFAASPHALQLLLLNALPAVKAVTATSSTRPRSSAHAAPGDRWWTGCLLAIHSFKLVGRMVCSQGCSVLGICFSWACC